MRNRRGVALVSVLLLLLTATALAHGALLLARAELAASAVRAREAMGRARIAARLEAAVRSPLPSAWSELPVWGHGVIAATEEATPGAPGPEGVLRVHRLGPESWWLEHAADSLAPRQTGAPAYLVWWMDPLTRIRDLGAVVSVGYGARWTVAGPVDRASFAVVPPTVDAATCDRGVSSVDFVPNPVGILPEGVERPTLGLLPFDTLLVRTTVTVEGTGSPTPSEEAGTCRTKEPWSWGDPQRPEAPCAAAVAVRGAPSGLRVDGGVGHTALVVDGDLELSGDARLYGFVMTTGALVLRDQAELHGVAVASGGVTVGIGARVVGSACWAASALQVARAAWMPTPMPVPGVPLLAP